jgi:hypothetical protein
LCFELGLYFQTKYKKQLVRIKNSQDIGFSALFYGISLMRFFLLIGDYYAIGTITSPFLIWSDGSFRFLLLNFGYLSINIGFLLFTFYMEKYKKILLKKYFFSLCFLVQIFIFISMVLIDLFSILYLSILLLPLFTIFLLIYAKDFNKQAKKQKIPTSEGLKMGFSILLLLSGHVLTIDFVCYYFGFITRLAGISMQLIAIGLIFKMFRNFIPFFEFNWQDKIENIYILNRDGINLYSKSFLEERKTIDDHFISGVLSSINIMLNELMNTKENKISIIKKKNKVVTIFTSVYIIGVIVSTDELEFFKHNLKRLVLKIEMLYRNILINWSGDRTKFYPVKDIVTDIFSI